MVEILHHTFENGGQFEILYSGKHAGLMEYIVVEKKITITHTEIDREFNGKGFGKELVLASVDFARKNNIKILPLCPFAKNIFEKNTDLEDVLEK